MQFTLRNSYPWPADIVVQVFADQDFFTEKYRRCGAENIRVLAYGNEGGKSHITVERQVRLAEIPAFARRILPTTLTRIQSDDWDRHSKTGHIDIQLTGVPARITCDMVLADSSDGAQMTLNFQISVNVPLVGERLARLLAVDLKRKFRVDSEQAALIIAELAPRYGG
jgi:hypothetical protein